MGHICGRFLKLASGNYAVVIKEQLAAGISLHSSLLSDLEKLNAVLMVL